MTYTKDSIVFAKKPNHPRCVNIEGKSYERLTILGYAGRSTWFCECVCGKIVVRRHGDITSGKTKSCGCLRSEMCIQKNIVHGLSHTAEYAVYLGMKDRCYNVNEPAYKNYGGRGIIVCDRWRNSFKNFIADMGNRPSPKHTIDRINNDGDYCPENCRWVTRKVQNCNKRNTVVITINGISKSLMEWADIYQMPSERVRTRIAMGWDVERALQTPVGKCVRTKTCRKLIQ